jgi:hypothetical protein
MAKSQRKVLRDVTRAGAAAILQTSVASVRRCEERGDLRPRRDELGIHWFDAEEVMALAQRRTRRARVTSVTITARDGAKLAALAGVAWPFDGPALVAAVEALRRRAAAALRIQGDRRRTASAST